MNKTKIHIIVTVAALSALVFALACSQKTKTKAPEKATQDKPYEFDSEGTVPPPVAEEVVTEADVEEIPVAEDEILGEDVEAPKDTTKVAGGGPGAVSGKDGGFAMPVFRVQILATSSEQSALDTEKKVERRLSLPAYVTFEDGMYKVRVGDSATREEAEKVRNTCRQAGYSDAWIVTDVIRGEGTTEAGGD